MKKETSLLGAIFYIVIVVFLIVGEVKCLYKACKCNWEPIGKAEVIYTASAFTGIGCIVGYFDIEDK
jgi:hypothetical protein